ncbi:MAG: 50S ribosomal protein L24, partial [Proteobacteria bacterium]|nr:50S ribosomal protein L24 [Pseudomonadota bacterium]
MKMKVRKGDNVVVLAGKDKGKTGEVLRAWPKKQRVLVQRVNMVKRHMRASTAQT